MALPRKITKTDAAELLGIVRVTLDRRIASGAYKWPAANWAALVADHVKLENAGVAPDSDDARFRRARADQHEIEVAAKRGLTAPIAMIEEQVASIFGLFVQTLEGFEARLRRLVGVALDGDVKREFRDARDSLARGVDKFCADLEERSRNRSPGAGSARGRMGVGRADPANGQRRAGPV